MKIIVNPDNELEVYEGNRKVAYVENQALFAIDDNDMAEYVDTISNRNEVLPLLKQHFRR